MYYFVDWQATPDGREPTLPEEVSYLMLAEPRQPADYALFECELPDSLTVSKHIQPVPEHLTLLLDSAKQYPPALALTREEVEQQSYADRQAFAETLAERLQWYLGKQKESRFFLAQVRQSADGYKLAGAYDWIVDYQLEATGREIAWVSLDYFVYYDAVKDFVVASDELAQRFIHMPE